MKNFIVCTVHLKAYKNEEGTSSFKIITGKPTGKRPLEMPRRRWEDHIRMDLKEIGINTRHWIDYCKAVVNAALNLRVQ